MKKVLLLGGSHRDIPLIEAAKDLGLYVITLGNKDYYLGHNYSNKAFKIDFNDLEKIREIIKKEKVDFLLPGCGEESYLNTVKLSKEFNIGRFDKLEIAKIIHNKWKFKKFCLKNNILTPKGVFYKEGCSLSNLKFPIVVKPTNLSGGRGVGIVSNITQLEESLQKANKFSDEIFLEEFIEGKLIAYSIFLKDQKIIYGFCGEDKIYLNKYLISTAFPYKIKDETLEKLKFDIEKLASLLNLVDGMFHLQVLIKDDTFYIIDVTRRIPGDLYPYLIEYNDSVKYSKAVVKSYLGIKLEDEFSNKNNSNKFIIRHCVMPDRNGKFKSLYIDKSIKESILYRLDLIERNSIINNFLQTQVAILIIKGDKNISKNINKLIYAKID